jgi:hypothetical protein
MTRDRRGTSTSTGDGRGLTTVYVVIGHGRWIDDGFEIIGVFADADDAAAAEENPDGWNDAYTIEEEVEYPQIRGW